VERKLLHDGESVPLTPKSFDLLLALVEHHGHLLEKDALMKMVWPDTFVEEANLSYNISLIRKALRDGENGQKFIETVPKRGYRFVALVREMGAEQAGIDEAVARHTEGETRREPLASKFKRHRKGPLLAMAALVIAFGGIGFGLCKFINRPQTKTSGAEPKVAPFTSFPGEELQPAFSPDGNQIAFVRRKEKDGNTERRAPRCARPISQQSIGIDPVCRSVILLVSGKVYIWQISKLRSRLPTGGQSTLAKSA
jgi:DNA-binding winged helix-turn-helix (wHTH) protein